MASTPSSSGRSPASGTNAVLPYRMHVSQRYLDLTRQKLELARLPREPQPRQLHQQRDFGVSKAVLEPLVDHWVEEYNWRAQEAFYNERLPQYRLAIHGTRIHFVHKRSMASNAIPILFVHGWPESFITVANIIDALCNPAATHRRDENVLTFHVVVPSIPGFGFSDYVSEEGNNIATTAEAFDALMKSIGYPRYIAHGSGWGLNICRMIALTHSESCIAIHTCNPDLPPPRTNLGYATPDFAMSGVQLQVPGVTPPLSPGSSAPQNTHGERPQTMAYALCDSPIGLLAYIVDAIRPPLSPPAPQPGAGPTPIGLQNPWTAGSVVSWAMLYWLPGPEVALRWLVNSGPMVPNLWTAFSNVPLAVSQYDDQSMPSPSLQFVEAYHRIAMLRRRPGVVRFATWERPDEIAHDIRDLAILVAPSFFGGFVGGAAVGIYQ